VPVKPLSIDAWAPLPPKVHRKNNALYLVHSNKWHFLGRTVESAKREYKRLSTDMSIPVVEMDFLRQLTFKAASRARRLRVPFSIDADGVGALFEQQAGKCALTGLKLDCCNAVGYKRRPWAPSLDRKIPALGYTPENTRLVCFAVNAAMNTWGEQEFEKVALGFLKRRGVI
jgi:hypothetical protein